MGALSGSYYHSFSTFGQSLLVDPVTRDFILRRLPVDIKGIEVAGELKLNKAPECQRHLLAGARQDRIHRRGAAGQADGRARREPGQDQPGAQLEAGRSILADPGRDQAVLARHQCRRSDEEHTRGYTLLDLSARYDLGRWGGLRLGIENLLDKQYELSFSQVAGSFLPYLAGRGRVVSISHEINF
jgi:iron complex outermembrane receptor protein